MREAVKSDRTFRLWEFQVGHSQLLLRSPRASGSDSGPPQTTNLDLVFEGVLYVSLPWILRGLEIVAPTEGEVDLAQSLVSETLDSAQVRIVFSNGQRYIVVAHAISLRENDWDNMDSPFKFRTRPRDLSPQKPVRRIAITERNSSHGADVARTFQGDLIIDSPSHVLVRLTQPVSFEGKEYKLLVAECVIRDSIYSHPEGTACTVWFLRDEQLMTALPDEALRLATRITSVQASKGLPGTVRALDEK